MNEGNKGVVMSAVDTAAGTATASAMADARVNFAVQHMLAAARFSREAGTLENQHRALAWGDFWAKTIFHSATACVMTSVASLEAYANDLFSDHESIFVNYSPELLHDLWETYERKPVLEKFAFALLLLRKPNIDPDSLVYQNVAALIELRNGLTHFHPEWMSETDEHRRISAKLNYKFAGGPFLPDTEPLFPRRWAGHSCTMWAVRSAVTFARYFERLADLPPKYDADAGAFNP